MELQPGVLYQHRDGRPFRLWAVATGMSNYYMSIDEHGHGWAWPSDHTEKAAIRYPFSEELQSMAIVHYSFDMRLPEGF